MIPPILSIGFRPFFLGAGAYAAVVMGLWVFAYRGAPIPGADLFGPTMWWHAHALIYGFAMAAIAGFLLTAVQNWTKRTTLTGGPLALLFGLWLAARTLPHLGASIGLVASFDLAFNLMLLVAVSVPLVQAKRWRDISILSTKLLTLTVGNALVYFAPGARRLGLYLGLYVVIAVIMTIGNRVFPMFIELGLGNTTIKRAPRLALLNLGTFVAFVIADLGWPGSVAGAGLAVGLVVINGWRLHLWTRRGVIRKPLLWVLIAGYGSIVLGFALRALSFWWPQLTLPGVHALTVGGIGLIVLGMMSRVSLGHTGNNVRTPERPGWLVAIFGALLLSAMVRVLVPLTGLFDYGTTVLVAQLLWTFAFIGFVVRFAPVLLAPRKESELPIVA